MSPRREIIVPAVHAPDTASSFCQAVSTVVRGGDFLFVRGLTAVDVLLQSMLEAPNMNEGYARFFPDPPPARTVCGARLPDGAKVIIECTALA